MFRSLVTFIILVLGVSPVCAGEIDAAKLRSHLGIPFTLSIGFNFTSLFSAERVPASPKAEIVRLEKQLTGKSSDAPLHLRMGELYRMLDSGQPKERYSKQRDEQYALAAQQYKTLLEKSPLDPDLVVGYSRSEKFGVSDTFSASIPFIPFPMELPAGSKEQEEMLRNVIEAHPDAWKARLELAERLESRAKEGLLAGMMRKMYESATSEASTSEPPDEGTSEESAPVIPPDMLSQLPEGLTQEQIEGLDKQAAEQRDLAARAAPKESQVYLARFNSRLGAAFFKYMFLDRMQEAPKLDKAATMKMIKDAINPSDLRKAWKYDPTNATLLRTLVFFEIANVLLDESSHTPFKELGNNILNEDPNKRTWNLISAANRGKLAGYEGGIRNAIKSHPSDVWAAYEALGLLKAFQGERKEAETAFTVAAKMTDKADLSYMVLFASRAENLSGDSSAQEGAKNVIPIWEMRVKVSGSPADMLNLAGAYAEVDQLDKAESLVRQALRLDSEDPAAHSLLGAILLKRQSDPQEAIQHLEKAISLSLSEEDWNTENARLNLGIAYALVSNMDKSREALGKVGGEGNPHTTALEILKELEVGAGHVIYCSTEYVAIGPDGTMGKTQPNNSYASTAITTFTAEAGSIVITQPEGYLTVIPPTSRIDPSDTPAADYEPGRIVVKFPDNSRRVYPEGSTMEILTAPRTFGGS